MTGFFPDIQLALRLRAFRQWVLACGLGAMVYFFLNHILVPVLTYGHDADSLGFSVFIAWFRGVGLATQVGLIGLCQWWVLRRYFAQAWHWLAITALCSAIAVVINHSFISYYPSLYPLAVGLCIGSAQWLFFRKMRQSFYWIVAVVMTQYAIHILFYMLASPLDVLSLEPVSLSATEAILTVALALLRYVMACLVQGLFTGIVLARLIATDKRRLVI